MFETYREYLTRTVELAVCLKYCMEEDGDLCRILRAPNV
jgi:hypothetical protein